MKQPGKPHPDGAEPQWERANQKPHYLLKLYVAGSTPRSLEAIASIKQICEEHLQGRYALGVVDIYQQPEEAKSADILAVPTLIKRLPLPLRKLIGSMANPERVLVGLGLLPQK